VTQSGALAYVEHNRAYWDREADSYQLKHGPQLRVERPGWGVWQIPEDEVHALGPVDGKDVLELGCGAAQWSIALAKRGAHVVGLDVSERQLTHARKLMAEEGVHFPLVASSAESTPFSKESFDVVFCDHGAIGFADPYKAIPEAARVLRPGGLLAFSMMTPFADACWPAAEESPGSELAIDYFGMHRREDGETVEFQLGYGDWIRLFAASGLTVEDLIELHPPPDATSTYVGPDHLAWARRWPLEHIWKARKPG
jgi:SAM-dependent methyltransferase